MQVSNFPTNNPAPEQKVIELCTLRQELQLSRKHGKDYWTLYDPCNGKFFRIDKLTFKILKYWHLKTAQKVQFALSCENQYFTIAEIMAVDAFLRQQYLCVADAKSKKNLLTSFNKTKKLQKSILQKYLFFKIPLLRPQGLLNFLYPKLKIFFYPGFWYFILSLSVISVVLILRQWDLFWHSISNFLRFEGLFTYILVIIFSKCVHELGHALTLRHYGVRVPSLGVAILMFMPLMYTDASESWRLTNPKARLHIAGAGILAEIMLATLASIGWLILDDGALRSGCFVLATSNWVMTLLFNMNPLMRFDGYFILSDYLHMENLQGRAIAQVKRKIAWDLFRLPIKYAEKFSKRKTRILIGFGIAVIAYRLSVIAGIITLVYMFFFKFLGVILLVHQVWKSLLFPLVRGIKWLHKNWKDVRFTRSSYVSFFILLCIIFLLVVPLPQRIFLQGQISSIEEYNIVIPNSGTIESALSTDVHQVSKDEVLMTLVSPRIEFELKFYNEQLNKLKQELSLQYLNSERSQERLITLEEITRTEKAIELTQQKKSELVIKAPNDGFIEWFFTDLKKGQTLGEKEIIAKIVVKDQGQIIAFVSEQDRDFINIGDMGYFIAQYDSNIKIPAKVNMISEHVVSELQEKVFDAKFGGSILTDNKNKPMNSYYRIELTPLNNELVPKEIVGTLVLNTGYDSLLNKMYKKIQGLLIRESVF